MTKPDDQFSVYALICASMARAIASDEVRDLLLS